LISAIVIFALLLLLLASVVTVVRSRPSPSINVSYLNTLDEVDIEVLSLLLSRKENEYLRKFLTDDEFRWVRRRRVSLVRKYLGAISRNTRQLTRAADLAKSSTDPEVVQAAHELMLIAFRVRLNLPIVHLCLVAEWLMPNLTLVRPLGFDAYRKIAGRGLFILRRLQTQPSRMDVAS